MQAASGQVTAPRLQALLRDGALAGEWALDPRKSSIALKSRSMWGLATALKFPGLWGRVSDFLGAGHGLAACLSRRRDGMRWCLK